MMRHLTVFPLIIQPGSKFPDHVNISRILVWKSNRQLQKHIMDLFEVIKCSTQVPTVHSFDQQLYAISQQVKWSRSGIFEPHILRLVGFHSLSTFFRIN
jgi:hypothetical protein